MGADLLASVNQQRSGVKQSLEKLSNHEKKSSIDKSMDKLSKSSSTESNQNVIDAGNYGNNGTSLKRSGIWGSKSSLKIDGDSKDKGFFNTILKRKNNGAKGTVLTPDYAGNSIS